MTFRNILFSALVVGIVAGSLYGIFQQLKISPIIYAAEVYEVVEPAVIGDIQDEAQEPWAPADGIVRILSTLGGNILAGMGFALLLISAMSLHNLKSNKPKLNWQAGILWGLGLLAILFIAPSLLGLLPEIPGTLAQTLENRQIWWVFSALATATGLAVIYYASRFVKLVGVALVALPHVIGAPTLATHSYANGDPAAVAALNELSHQFVIMTSVGMLIFCVLLGALSGFVSTRFVRFG